MSKARLIITAVLVEGRTKSEVARDYDVSRYWVHDGRTTVRMRCLPRSRIRSSRCARS